MKKKSFWTKTNILRLSIHNHDNVLEEKSTFFSTVLQALWMCYLKKIICQHKNVKTTCFSISSCQCLRYGRQLNRTSLKYNCNREFRPYGKKIHAVFCLCLCLCFCLIWSIWGDPQMLCINLYVFQYINRTIDVLRSYCALESTYCAHKDTHVHSDVQLIRNGDSVEACVVLNGADTEWAFLSFKLNLYCQVMTNIVLYKQLCSTCCKFVLHRWLFWAAVWKWIKAPKWEQSQ